MSALSNEHVQVGIVLAAGAVAVLGVAYDAYRRTRDVPYAHRTWIFYALGGELGAMGLWLLDIRTALPAGAYGLVTVVAIFALLAAPALIIPTNLAFRRRRARVRRERAQQMQQAGDQDDTER